MGNGNDQRQFDQFEPESVSPEAWEQQTAELESQLPESKGDRRIVHQVAWLLAAGAPIRPFVVDAIAGVKMASNRPGNPIGYFRESLSNALGKERFEFYLGRAPPRSACRNQKRKPYVPDLVLRRTDDPDHEGGD